MKQSQVMIHNSLINQQGNYHNTISPTNNETSRSSFHGLADQQGNKHMLRFIINQQPNQKNKPVTTTEPNLSTSGGP